MSLKEIKLEQAFGNYYRDNIDPTEVLRIIGYEKYRFDPSRQCFTAILHRTSDGRVLDKHVFILAPDMYEEVPKEEYLPWMKDSDKNN